jgi:hypothetical protein
MGFDPTAIRPKGMTSALLRSRGLQVDDLRRARSHGQSFGAALVAIREIEREICVVVARSYRE